MGQVLDPFPELAKETSKSTLSPRAFFGNACSFSSRKGIEDVFRAVGGSSACRL